jgi:hypothetical protein
MTPASQLQPVNSGGEPPHCGRFATSDDRVAIAQRLDGARFGAALGRMLVNGLN